MALAVSASVVGVSNPRAVQVVVSGLTVGVSFEVRGTGGGVSWPVRAGRGVAAGSQLVLNDIHTPVNTPVTYEVWQGPEAASSSPVTVDYAGRYVLQSLDGSRSVVFRWIDNGDPRDFSLRVSSFAVPGRSTPVTRFDVGAGESGMLVAATAPADTETMRSLVLGGAPLLVRTDGDCRDLRAVEFVHVVSAQNAWSGYGSERRWSLGFVVVADPEPGTLVPSSTWDDFDESYVGLTWSDFDAEWAGSTWDDFDVEDWAVRSSGA